MGFVVGNLQHGVDRVDMGKDRIGAYVTHTLSKKNV